MGCEDPSSPGPRSGGIEEQLVRLALTRVDLGNGEDKKQKIEDPRVQRKGHEAPCEADALITHVHKTCERHLRNTRQVWRQAWEITNGREEGAMEAQCQAQEDHEWRKP